MVKIFWRGVVHGVVPSIGLYYLIFLAFGWRGVIAVMLIGWGAFVWEIL
jgi:hypothetical protein